MPEISRFYGIIIKMIFNDNDKHHKPHVHVYYGEYEASMALDGEVLEGKQMYVMNGIVYGGTPTESVSVSAMKILSDKIMLITFSNGETRLFDASILIGEVFAPLDDETVFKDGKIDHGVVTWLDGEIDCAPEFMYENSYAYSAVS